MAGLEGWPGRRKRIRHCHDAVRGCFLGRVRRRQDGSLRRVLTPLLDKPAGGTWRFRAVASLAAARRHGPKKMGSRVTRPLYLGQVLRQYTRWQRTSPEPNPSRRNTPKRTSVDSKGKKQEEITWSRHGRTRSLIVLNVGHYWLPMRITAGNAVASLFRRRRLPNRGPSPRAARPELAEARRFPGALRRSGARLAASPSLQRTRESVFSRFWAFRWSWLLPLVSLSLRRVLAAFSPVMRWARTSVAG